MSKKKTVSVANDGSYLQAHVSRSVPVSTILPSVHANISMSTRQATLTMLSQIDASKDLSRCMDLIGSISSTPLTSPTLHHRSSSVAAAQSVLPLTLMQDAVGGGKVIGQGDSVASRAATQPLVHNTINRDSVVPVIRSIPSISSSNNTATGILLQAVQDALPGKGYITRQKSRRYNTNDTTFVVPRFRWPNEGLVTASHSKKPAYDDLNLPP